MELIKNLKETSIIKNLFIAICGTIILAVSAKVKIPFYPVPMTMQTFVVLLLGISLGWKLGLFTVSLYLIQGIAGLPVFAGTPEKGVGIIYFTGPTMGYLIGFIVTVYLAGKFNYDGSLVRTFFQLTFATSFIYILGMLWLGSLIGWEKPIFELGAQPFLLAELLKVLIATLMVKQFKRFRKFI